MKFIYIRQHGVAPFTVNRPTTRTHTLATLFVAALINVGSSLVADAADSSVQRLPATATIQFAGTSTLHDFGGSLPSQPFTLVLSKGTWSADANVLSGLMNTAHEKRDRKMHEMFATNSFPKMHGAVTTASIPGAAGTNATLRLIIRDKTNDLTARISGWTEDASAIKFHATWELSLKDYALKPPSVLGVIKVGDRIQLEADVTASKTISAPAPSAPKP
jgi:polyisoprenoid-binding protein YceI